MLPGLRPTYLTLMGSWFMVEITCLVALGLAVIAFIVAWTRQTGSDDDIGTSADICIEAERFLVMKSFAEVSLILAVAPENEWKDGFLAGSLGKSRLLVETVSLRRRSSKSPFVPLSSCTK